MLNEVMFSKLEKTDRYSTDCLEQGRKRSQGYPWFLFDNFIIQLFTYKLDFKDRINSYIYTADIYYNLLGLRDK